MPSDLKSFMSCQSQTISTQANKKGSKHDSEAGMDVYSGVVDIHLNEYVPSEEGLRPISRREMVWTDYRGVGHLGTCLQSPMMAY